MLYGTTDEFLKQFGFETLKDLPQINDIAGVLDDDGEPLEHEMSEEEMLMMEQISLVLPDKQDDSVE